MSINEIAFDCVHIGCLTENIAHRALVAVTTGDGHWSVFLQCKKCLRGTVAYYRGRPDFSPLQGDLKSFQAWYRLDGSAPAPLEPEIIEYLPENVRTAWLGSQDGRNRGHHGMAAMGYRRVLERVIADLHPEVTGKLHQKLGKLRGELPAALIAMADGIRFLGNDGAHDELDPPASEIEDAHAFTRLFLVYSYELPARIQRATDARDARRAKSG